MKNVMCLMILLIPVLSFAQEDRQLKIKDNGVNKHEIKPLTIGDQLPANEYLFTEIKNYKNKILKWSDLRGKKLIILDFWNRYCTACITAFPKMERLQEQFGKNIQIILITDDSRKDLARLFDVSENVKNTSLPIVMDDTIFTRLLFPHNTVPYHVWLTDEGKVVATVNSQETTAENIQRFLSGQDVQMSMRSDNVSDILPRGLDQPTGSFLTVENGRLAERIIYYAQIQSPRITNQITETAKTRHIGHSFMPVLKQYSVFFSGMNEYNISKFNGYLEDSLGNRRGLKLFNHSMSKLLRLAYRDFYLGGESVFKLKFLVEGDASKYFEQMADSTNKKRFVENNRYCYESSMNEYSEENALKILREDIARCFGLRAKLEERTIQCAVIKIIDSAKLNTLWSDKKSPSGNTAEIINSGNSIIRYKSMGFGMLVTNLFNGNRHSSLPYVVDSTGLPRDRAMDMTLHISSFALTTENKDQVCREMEKYGLSIEIVPRKENIIVLYNSL